MKKLNITKERFNKSRYFQKKYGALKFMSESGNLYKTEKGMVLKFLKEDTDVPDFGDRPINAVQPTGDVEQDFNNAMVALRDDNYEAFIKDLNTLANDPKIEHLRDAIIQKFNSPDGVSVQFSKATAMNIRNIHPTQFEVDMEKSLKFPLKENPGGIDDAFSGKPICIRNIPLVVAEVDGVNYIIDGHHRWSQVYCMNPDAQMVVRVIKSDMFKNADDVLKLVQMQLFIAKDGGELPQATVDSEYNLYTIQEKAFKEWCAGTMTEEAKQTFAKYIKDDPIQYMWKNVMVMRNEAQPTPNAHGRGDMPQTDKVSGEYMKPKATPVSEKTAMKKLKVTKERFEKSRYFQKKYGRLEYVSESGKTYKTANGTIVRFITEAREYVDDDSIEEETAEEFIIFEDPDIFTKIAEVQKKKGKEVQDEVKSGDVNAEQVAQAATQVQNSGSTAATIAAVGGVASTMVNGAATLANSPLVMGLAAAAGYKQVLNKAGEIGEQIGDDFWKGYEELSGRAQQARDMEKHTAELTQKSHEQHADWVKWANAMIAKSNIVKKNPNGGSFDDQVWDRDEKALMFAKQLQDSGQVVKHFSNDPSKITYYTKDELKKWFDTNGYTIDSNGVVNRTDSWIDPETGKPWKDAAIVAGTTTASTTATSGGWTLFGMSAATVGWIVAGVAAAALITPYIYDKVRACAKTWLADIIAEVKFKADGKAYRCFYDLKENKWVLTYANVKWTSYLDNKLDQVTIDEFFASQFFAKFLDKCKQTFAFLFSTSKNEVVFKTLPEIKDAPKELKDILEKIYDNKGAITKNLFTGKH